MIIYTPQVRTATHRVPALVCFEAERKSTKFLFSLRLQKLVQIVPDVRSDFLKRDVVICLKLFSRLSKIIVQLVRV